MAKPVVDGIEKDLAGRAQVLRVGVGDEVGLQLAQRYGVHSLPTLIVLDGEGRAYKKMIGIPNRAEVVQVVTDLLPK